MEEQQMLGVLLNITEQQSQTTERLLTALKKQIDTLDVATRSAQQAALTAGQSASNVTTIIQQATSEAVHVAVTHSLADISKTASAALEAAVKPVMTGLTGMVQTAQSTEAAMLHAGAWFAWKWVAIAAGGLAGVCLVAYLSLWWQRGEFESLRQKKAELENEVAELQTNIATLKKKGGRITLSSCIDREETERLCVPVSSHQGTGYQNTKTGVQYVIPRGY